MGFRLHTERLTLRDYTPDDYDLVRELFLNPSLAQQHSRGQDCEPYAQQLFDYGRAEINRQPRMGYDLALISTAGEKLGICALKRYSYWPTHAYLNWDVLPQYWRCGFASEAASRLIEFGFTELRLEVIEASAFADNVASIRVMEKIGLSPQHNRPIVNWWRALTAGESRPTVRYQLTHEKWLASRVNTSTSQPFRQFQAAAN